MQYNSRFGLPEVGSRHQNKSGQWFTVVDVDGCKKITVKFDARPQHLKVTTSHYVRTGTVGLPTYFVGDVLQDKFGVDIKIVEINTVSKITFEWPDGYRRTCQSSAIRNNCLIREEDSNKLNPEMKVGQIWPTKQGCKAKILEYNGSCDILVEFVETPGYILRTNQGNLKAGNLHNKYAPSVAGVGIVGDVEYDPKNKLYVSWSGMLTRACRKEYKERSPTYYDCTLSDEWRQLSKFKEWFDLQVVEDDWALDKDLLSKGNKEYGPKFCVFLPREINTFTTSRVNHRGQWPLGVTYHERLLKWQASCSCGGHKNSEYLGVFSSPEAAFGAYKKRKEEYAKELAEKWKDKIDPRAYTALMNYTVEITD